jgi:hypothetical protein
MSARLAVSIERPERDVRISTRTRFSVPQERGNHCQRINPPTDCAFYIQEGAIERGAVARGQVGRRGDAGAGRLCRRAVAGRSFRSPRDRHLP